MTEYTVKRTVRELSADELLAAFEKQVEGRCTDRLGEYDPCKMVELKEEVRRRLGVEKQ